MRRLHEHLDALPGQLALGKHTEDEAADNGGLCAEFGLMHHLRAQLYLSEATVLRTTEPANIGTMDMNGMHVGDHATCLSGSAPYLVLLV